MTALAVTNTFSNGTVITADTHNTNYSDIVTYVNNRNSGSSSWDAIYVTASGTVPMIINNSTGTQDILRAQDNGSNVMVIADGGIITTASQSAARVYRNTSTQSISAATITKVQFNGETYDIQSEFDSATNFRFTASKTGKYLITSTVSVGSAGTINLYIYKNGASIAQYDDAISASNSISISDCVSLTATDYIEIHLKSDGINTVVNGEGTSFLAIHKVA